MCKKGITPYGAHFEPSKSESTYFEASSDHQCDFGFCSEPAPTKTNTNPLGAGSLPVQSDRVKWKHPPSFAAAEFLKDPLLKAAYEDPEVLRKPNSEWPPSRPAKVQCSKQEFLKLARRWDELGACCPHSSQFQEFRRSCWVVFASQRIVNLTG